MIHGFVGTCGMGKTYTMQLCIGHELERPRHRWRFLVCVTNDDDWPGPLRPWLDVMRSVETLEQAGRALRAHPIVLVHPPLGRPLGPHRVDGTRLRGFGDELAKLACDGPATILVLPEAQHAMPQSFRELDPSLRLIVHQYRHRQLGGVGLWWDTQSFADVAVEVRKATQRLYLFGNSSSSDLDEFRRLGGTAGAELVRAVEECGVRAELGEKGFHVQLSTLSRRPPFELRRIRRPVRCLRSRPEKSSGGSPEPRRKVLTASGAGSYAEANNAGSRGPGRENP